MHDLQQLAKDSGHEQPLLIGIDQENGAQPSPNLFSRKSEAPGIGLVSGFSVGSGEVGTQLYVKAGE